MGWFVGGRVPRGGSAPPARTLRLSVDLPSTEQLANLNEFGELAPVSLSPDGQTIVYAALRGGVRQLFRRRFDQGVATPIPGTEGARVSFFSPDGSTIGFSTDSDLKKVSLAGGEPVLVRQLWQSGVLRAASWGDDGTIVVGFQNFENPLWSLPASSGEPRRFTSLTERGENVHHDPAHLPGDRGLLYSANGKTIILRSRDGKESVLTEGRSPRFVASGHIVFLRNQSLWAMAFDPNSAAAGSPVKIADGVAGSIAVSADGTLVYVGGRPGAAQLVWVDANGHEQVVAGGPTGAYQDVVLSPDGGRIALTVRTPDYGTDVFVYHVGRQRLTQITAEGGLTSAPLWTPDGKQLVFSSSRDKALRNLFRRAADGTGDIERLTTSPYQQSAWSWSADGQTLVMNQLNSDTSYDILGASVGALDKPLALVQTKETDLHPAVSPNGHLIAYSSGGQIWVSPFPNVSESHLQVSTAGGGQSRWSSDSRTLFYRSASAIMAATVVTSPALDVSVPRLVLKGEYMAPGGTKSWDVAPDGRFLLMKPVPAEPSIQVVLNWTEELKRLVPPK
jgi:Tol biopolymer transport system component